MLPVTAFAAVVALDRQDERSPHALLGRHARGRIALGRALLSVRIEVGASRGGGPDGLRLSGTLAHPDCGVHVQRPSALLLLAVPEVTDYADGGLAGEEPRLELLPAMVVVARGLDGRVSVDLPITRGAQIDPAHLVGGKREKELGRTVLEAHGHELHECGTPVAPAALECLRNGPGEALFGRHLVAEAGIGIEQRLLRDEIAIGRGGHERRRDGSQRAGVHRTLCLLLRKRPQELRHSRPQHMRGNET